MPPTVHSGIEQARTLVQCNVPGIGSLLGFSLVFGLYVRQTHTHTQSDTMCVYVCVLRTSKAFRDLFGVEIELSSSSLPLLPLILPLSRERARVKCAYSVNLHVLFIVFAQNFIAY